MQNPVRDPSRKPKPPKPKNFRKLGTTLDILLLIKNLSMMLESGVGIVKALDSIAEQTPKAGLKKLLKDLQQQIAEGNSLSSALGKYPGTFPPFFIKMIEVGEKSGTLTKTLDELAKQTEKDYELREKIKTAMLYPAIVLILTFVIGIGIAFFILPRLVKLFESFNVELPITTKILLALGKVFANQGFWVLGGIVLLIIIFVLFLKTPGLKPFWDAVTLNLPIVGRLVRYITLSRFGFLLSTLLDSGVPIDESLEATQKTILSTPYIKISQIMQAEIRQGRSFQSTFKTHKNLKRDLPLMAQQLIVSGEESGKLSVSLKNLASFYEREAGSAARRLETVLEPILLVVVGILVTFVALSIITPIYQITGSINR